MAANKYITNNAGVLVELVAPTTAGTAGDSGKIPALNADGYLDATIVNSVVTSAGNGSAAKVVALDSTGRIDNSMMPTGIGADTQAILTSEILVAGNLVNVYNNAGVANVRKADATVAGKEAHGFVMAGFASGVSATVHFEGNITGLTGLTAGKNFLSTTAGGSTATAPTVAGNVVQIVGFATSATTLNFQSTPPITLA
jgi:hypothetical protein